MEAGLPYAETGCGNDKDRLMTSLIHLDAHLEMLAAVLWVVASSALILIAAGRSPGVLRQAMAQRVARSIAVVDACRDTPSH
jgi:hypothetical protein